MRKIQRMSLHDFLHGVDQETFLDKAKRHIAENKTFYVTVAGCTLIFLFCGFDGSALADTGIDRKANSIYRKILGVGKWVIIIKGGLEIIQNASNGDYNSVKTKFFSCLLIFLALLALPWAMDEIEDLFDWTAKETSTP